MARHPFGPRAGRRNRNRMYTALLALLVVCVVIAFYYGPFGKNEADTLDDNTIPQPEVYPDSNVADVSEMPALPDTNEEFEPVIEPQVPEVNETTAFVPPVEVEPELPEAPPEPAPGPTVEPNPEAATLIAEAAAMLDEKPGRIIDARDKLNEALRMPMSAQQRSSVKTKLSELSEKWLMSRTIIPDDPLCESYQVRSGDLLKSIGDRHSVPYEILMTINNINRPEALQAGETIKVVNGPFHVKVYRSTFMMDLYLQTTYVRSFRVGLGKPGMETPTGLWRAKTDGKLVKPIWTNPIDGKTYHPEDPNYPLGSRWIALEGLSGEAKNRTGFAIHGTKEPEQIGSAGSQGCIRMHNGDAILIYNLMYPGLSQVEVTD
jgi:LysM repeat protein